MYSVYLDENGFFTGSYAIVGTIANGVVVDSLPPSENSLCYRLVDGNWQFSQERYDALKAAKLEAEEAAKAENEYQQYISNETLANRIAELESAAVSLESMSEAILKGVNEV